MGLLTVAALLPKDWKLRLIDMNVENLKDEDLQWADYIFISAMEIQKSSVKEVIRRAKRHRKRIVAGGPLFTISPEDYYHHVDHIIMQEAESSLPLFLKDLKDGNLKKIYKSEIFPDITLSPIPKWDLIDLKKYAAMSIQYCRGCPFNCDFCNIRILNGRRPRAKAYSQILSELDCLYNMGWRGIVFFVDDNFIGKPHRLKTDLLPHLIRWMRERNYPFSFLTEASINLADDEELMKLMVKAGFDSVFVGIESPEEMSLSECNKTQNLKRDLLSYVRKMQMKGLQVLGGFIVGFDNDPPTIFKRQVEFIQKSGIVTAMVGLLNAPKKTRLYNRLKRQGRIVGDVSGDNTDFSINFIPKMGYDRLLKGYRYIIENIYSPSAYYTRVKNFLVNYKMPDFRVYKLQLCYIKAFIQSVWELGIKGTERIHFWKTLIWTLLRFPRLIPHYIAFSIYGYHFRKVFHIHFHRNIL